MSNTQGIGPSGPQKPIEPATGPMGDKQSGSGEGGIQAALHTPVSNLDQLKQLLISSLGEEEGKKLYKSFMTTFAMMMVQQMQHSAQHAKEAAQHMRMPQ
jgi:hypothetical protein